MLIAFYLTSVKLQLNSLPNYCLNRLSLNNLRNYSTLLGDKINSSYAYSSIIVTQPPFESYPGDILIQYNSTSNKSYPDIRAKICDGFLKCQPEFIIKNGESTINNYNRWGDYSEIAMANRSNYTEFILTSSYGKNSIRQSYMTSFSKLNADSGSILSLIEHKKQPYNYNENMIFNTDNESEIEIRLNNKIIIDGISNKGLNGFIYNTKYLSKGDYTILITDTETKKTLKERKFQIR